MREANALDFVLLVCLTIAVAGVAKYGWPVRKAAKSQTNGTSFNLELSFAKTDLFMTNPLSDLCRLIVLPDLF